MSKDAGQAGPIAVYGATGYTGRLVAAELQRRGADFVLAGRNEAKLEIVAEDVGGAPVRAVHLDDAAGLRAMLDPCAAVISCAGPFLRYGEPVLGAALETGTHYLDTTGEQPYMRKVFEVYGARAERNAVAAVPAMGFDYAPGDMIAALAARELEAVDEITMAYCVRGFGASRGTMATALGALGGGDMEWRDGRLRQASQRVARGSWDFPEPIGRQRMVRYPAGEHVTVPRHVKARQVRTMLCASAVAPHPRLGIAVPLAMTPLQLASRTPLRRAFAAAVGRLPEGPGEAARRAARFTVVCEAAAGGRRSRGTVHGRDVYGFTARATVEGALACAEPGYDRRGALAPSQAFDPERFLRAMSAAGLSYEVTPA